ncbi:hypothetical protein BGM26_05795 [Bacillus sp. FJAT-29790]|uniref:hypothetical protein n=1 Tax=Bacillus sp. FJAT-29790 TaxID=1895002 RepID=UPI001C223552|nr:hypothetical protein [Bacillus sp. FJAT-29790]MBU8878501.1 hypothetical protein [Bacillus sp. FJAT-29790]
MLPLTAKEMEYIVDSMSNEDLLTKQCVSTGTQSMNVQVKTLCNQLINQHQQHYQDLMALLQQHQTMAPQQPQ